MTGLSLAGAVVGLLWAASVVGAVGAWRSRDMVTAFMAATAAGIFGAVMVWAVTA